MGYKISSLVLQMLSLDPKLTSLEPETYICTPTKTKYLQPQNANVRHTKSQLQTRKMVTVAQQITFS